METIFTVDQHQGTIMEIEIGTRIQLRQARRRQPDAYNAAGWEGEVIGHENVTEVDAKASGFELCDGENIFTVKWDNGYISDVYPENGDRLALCETP